MPVHVNSVGPLPCCISIVYLPHSSSIPHELSQPGQEVFVQVVSFRTGFKPINFGRAMMEHYNVDITLEYDEGDFNNSFGSQLSSASSARSYSTAPSCVPITPQSGRSSPSQRTASMSFTSISDYSFTPPGSSMDGYFPSTIKPEFHPHDTIPTTPSKKSTISPYNMNFEQSTLMSSTLPSYDHMMEFAPPGLDYSFSDHLPTSPFNHHQSTYPAAHHSDTSSLWAWPSQSSSGYSERSDSPESATLCLKNLCLQEASTLPPPYVHSSLRRQVSINDVQQKSSILHHVQNGGRVAKKGKGNSSMCSLITKISPGQFKCMYPECADKKKGYKRAEHLKRHWDS